MSGKNKNKKRQDREATLKYFSERLRRAEEIWVIFPLIMPSSQASPEILFYFSLFSSTLKESGPLLPHSKQTGRSFFIQSIPRIGKGVLCTKDCFTERNAELEMEKKRRLVGGTENELGDKLARI